MAISWLSAWASASRWRTSRSKSDDAPLLVLDAAGTLGQHVVGGLKLGLDRGSRRPQALGSRGGLFPGGREFLVQILGLGFALAQQPVLLGNARVELADEGGAVFELVGVGGQLVLEPGDLRMEHFDGLARLVEILVDARRRSIARSAAAAPCFRSRAACR